MADQDNQGTWLKVFCPQASCLSDEEVANLPDRMRQAPGVAGKDGLWLKVFCPDQACLTEGERPELPEQARPQVFTQKDAKARGTWLRLFCPDDACLAGDDTEVV